MCIDIRDTFPVSWIILMPTAVVLCKVAFQLCGEIPHSNIYLYTDCYRAMGQDFIVKVVRTLSLVIALQNLNSKSKCLERSIQIRAGIARAMPNRLICNFHVDKCSSEDVSRADVRFSILCSIGGR